MKQLLKTSFYARTMVMLGLFAFLFSACGSEDDPLIQPLDRYASGVLVANEGPFQNGVGSITFFDPLTGEVEQNVFERANNRVLGNIVQSVTVFQDRAYVVVNNAGKVEVANAADFSSVGVIEGLTLPRYFLGIDGQTGYISQWGAGGTDGSITVVDLSTLQITKTIAVGNGAGRMLRMGNEVFVACSGGFGNDNRLFVINTNSQTVTHEIAVGANPNSLRVDANNTLWVLCGGQFSADFTSLVASPELFRIDPVQKQITGQFSFDDFNSTASNLVINAAGTSVYFLKGGSVFVAPTTAGNQLSFQELYSGFYYGLGYNPNDGLLYATDAGDFVGNGSVLLIDESGVLRNEFATGIIPNGGFYFAGE